jgi:hypothetical protein
VEKKNNKKEVFNLKSIEEIERIEHCVSGSLAVENAFPSPECKKITRNYLEEKIQSKTAISRIKLLHGVRT